MAICESFLFQAINRVAILAVGSLFVIGSGAAVAFDFIDLYFLPLGYLPKELSYISLCPVNIAGSAVYPAS